MRCLVASGHGQGQTPAVAQRVMAEALGDGAELGSLAARSEALCDKRPLYAGFRGFPTYVA